ncbi:SWIM zinc finger family protein [Pseudomarimonas arenosa]|uniref:SWIM zinc finger family protein n=1 Tax=Pseudomarimonas arenosa TaxID=2774145 RepID=A0AAW3ZK65_9GAMM|nr:SWIM zinc finger family protein [Pseudomarimonas arenosa]MBD8524691.1 SWIM zinc finger family protein [Pseudomarimonas arenosa]
MAAPLRSDLLSLTPEALAQLANMGLLKRAQRELAAGYTPELDVQEDGTLIARFPDQVRTEFPPSAGLKEASCSCGAALCRHRIATILHYASAASTESDLPQLASFADLSETELRRQTTASFWPAVERELRQGIRIEVERSLSTEQQKPIYTARLPHATARYYAGADLGFARCDCQAQQRCEHIALGALALQRAPQLGEARLAIELGEPRADERKLDFALAPFIDLIAALLRDGLAHGAAESPRMAQALSSALRLSREQGCTWLSLSLESLEQWLELYLQRSARFAYLDGLRLLREISLRLAVVESGGADLSPRSVLGMGEAMETALDRLSLISLGLRVLGDGKERRATLAVVDCDTQTLLCLQKEWQYENNAGSSELARLDQQRVAGTLRFARLAQGSLVTTTARRRANGELRLGQSHAGKASVSAHNGDWSALRPPLLIEDQQRYLRQQAHAAPRELQARSALPGFHVLRVSQVVSLGYDPAAQRLHALLADASGAGWWLLRDHASATPGALDAIARVLLDAPDSPQPLYVAGVIRRGNEGLSIEPWALSLGRLVVPDASTADGSLSAVTLANAPHAAADPQQHCLAAVDEALCELLRDGLRRPRTTLNRLKELRRRAVEIGLRGEPERGLEAILERLLAELQGDATTGYESTVSALRELLNWLALAYHAAPTLDLESSEGL